MSGWDSTPQRSWRDHIRNARVTHVERLPRSRGTTENWPEWVPSFVPERLAGLGITLPWSHQVTAADLARSGNNVIIATGTASGKSLAFLLPAAEAVDSGRTVLYLSPSKALAADQRRFLEELDLPGMRAATYDGDTPAEQRSWIRAHANYVLTNPDMLHHSLLAQHSRWSGFLRRLSYVVVDEAHYYRGVFGSHVAQIIRRLRRLCARYRSEPTFVLASATTGTPEESAADLVGLPVRAVSADTSPRPALSFALVEPELTGQTGENGAPLRRAATAEAADILAGLVGDGVHTLAFVRSRQSAEVTARTSQRLLANTGVADPARKVAAYRAGYLAEDRRELEEELRSGELVGLATTSALELGVDVTGLDAVLIAGWPGTRASLWQQAGRAGRGGGDALAVFIARDDPLDTYLVHNPEATLGRCVEATVLDPDNPYVLAPHLCAAASELPLTDADLTLFGPQAETVVADLVDRKWLRRRPRGWFWTHNERASGMTDIRGTGGSQVQIVDAATGQLLGTVDEAAAHGSVHDGAVYLHQEATYVVDRLDVDDGVALVRPAAPEYTTWSRETTEISIRGTSHQQRWDSATVHVGDVEVARQVVGFLKRDVRTGAVLGEQRLDLPQRTLVSRAVWWTLDAEATERLRAEGVELRGAAHAAEHAAIGLLPLFATCDRWDIGGVSTALHPDTGLLTVFVYDGHQGGAGFAERGYNAAADWLRATRDAVAECACPTGCPSCVQSPKCGNGNEPLSKAGALRLLDTLLG
ncbi:DEAD/DEAH box helicase domain-containing protein [Haloactinospora alba]|uniref:DEAD/DEAH box helicase domain-containing protein n=1 Tax=Haloactinospora alba TaxID=405555 RepID=A0A543NA44_9ACTN|nr:DEAD/DEAH box helicase domain-containing protein [Haloactinospora alba]